MSGRLTTLGRIQGLIYGTPMRPHQVQQEILRLTGKMISESAITARFRELRHRGYDVVAHPAKGLFGVEWYYHIPRDTKVLGAAYFMAIPKEQHNENRIAR